ncbi:MAG: polysaccharide biosynthesis tyrosine autokinase [Pseudomonadota bacterium]
MSDIQKNLVDSDDENIDLRRYLRVVLKRKWMIAAVATTVLALTAVWTLRQPKIYRASTTILVETSAPKVLGQGVSEVVDLGTGSYWWNQEYFNTQINILQSRDVAERTIHKTPLLADPAFWDVGEGLDDPEDKKKAMESFDAAKRVQAAITVEGVKDARLVKVSVDDTKPERAVTVVNAMARAFVESNLERKLDTTQGAADWLGDQMAELKVKLETSEKAMQEFKDGADILTTSLEDRQRMISDRLVMLSNELTKTRLKKVEQEARLKQAHALRAAKPDDELGGDVQRDLLNSKVLEALKQRYLELKTQRADLAERYQAQHPKMMAVQQQMQIVRADLDREIERALRAEEAALNETLEVEKRLDEMLASERQVAGQLNRKEITYNQLQREVTNSTRMYELVNKRLKETDLTGVLKTNNMSVLDVAEQPRWPIKPNVQRNLAVGLVLGLLLALLAAFGLEYLDNTIKGHEDVEQVLGLPFLGLLPSIAEEGKTGQKIRRDLVVIDAPKSSATECARSLRTNLLFMSPDRPLRNFVVTSAGPQEGKTTVANALAITMAQAGSRVLIVDTDMRRPRLHKAYGVSNEVGVSSLIVGEATLVDAVKHTEIPGLDILPCGPIPPNPAEMLMSEAFKALRDQLAGQYERVIYDSPPVGAVTDPVILGTQTDGVVLVLKGGRTTKDIAQQCLRALRDANVRILGAVVNDLDIESRKYGYYYYSYYKKYGGYYGEYGPKEEKVKAV